MAPRRPRGGAAPRPRRRRGEGVHGAGAADIAAAVAAEVRAGDVVLVKGSLGMGMSAIIKALNDAAPVDAATAGGRGA